MICRSITRGPWAASIYVCTLLVLVQSVPAADEFHLTLWEQPAPLANGDQPGDTPSMIVSLPEPTTGSESDASQAVTGAIVIFPGGGYGGLAMDHEGHQIAAWVNRLGLAAVIVNYRHRGRGYGHPAPLLDAQRAIRLTRHHAAEWNVDPDRVGVLGFSAGGHLTTTTLTHFDAGDADSQDAVERHSSRPDFGIVCYAVIALGEDYTHAGSQRNLLGDAPAPELIQSLSNEKQVQADTPPCFVWHTAEDRVVPAENSLRFFSSLVASEVPAELHIFPEGRHGIGLAQGVPGADRWPSLCEGWLRRNHVIR